MSKLRKTLVLGAVLLVAACTRELVYAVPPQGMRCEAAPKEDVMAGAPVALSGLKVCPNMRRCTGDALLPPQPCEQPMPTYYDDISELAIDDGVLLIHPLTRTKVLCLEQPGMSVFDCVNTFRSEGYVLITDVPQFAGRYDLLQEGTYPTRRWRKGENVPRW